MPITMDQILEEARNWPREQVAKLVDSLTLSLQDKPDPQAEEEWKTETRRRLVELESGQVEAIPGDIVSERVRKIVGR
jgi:putative addiction module component (TIGR02574 family)